MIEKIPQGWRSSTIEECCNILDAQRIPLNSEERAIRQGDYPYYGANGIQGYIDDFIFEGDAILVAEDGGNFDQYEDRPIAQWVTGKYWVNNHAHILRAKENNLDKWIYYSLVHKNILNFINGGTRAKLNQSDLREIDVLLPPLPEQKKIASILTSVEEVIETTQKQIDKLRDLKKATMNELLTKGVGHTEFKESKLGRIPKSWSTTKLDECTMFIRDGTHGTHVRYNKGIPLLSAKNITASGKLFWDEEDSFISEADYNQIHSRYTIEEDDVLLTVVGTLGRVAVVSKDNDKFAVQRSVAIIRTDREQLIPGFCFQNFRGYDFQKQLVIRSNSTAQAGVYLGELGKIELSIPPLPEQKEIASILTCIDKNLETKKEKLSQTQFLKKSLMQGLLTGKVRVKVN